MAEQDEIARLRLEEERDRHAIRRLERAMEVEEREMERAMSAFEQDADQAKRSIVTELRIEHAGHEPLRQPAWELRPEGGDRLKKPPASATPAARRPSRA